MFERFEFLVLYIGSAAMAAFLAACLSSPRIAVFSCPASDAGDQQQCELAATLAAEGPDATVPLAAIPPATAQAQKPVNASAGAPTPAS